MGIVHKLTFSAEWETPFDRSNKVEFNDGNTYNFMQTTVYQASSFDSPQLKMVTIPFKSLNENEKIVIDFIVPQRESNYINLGHHGTWVANSVTKAETVITIPKIKFQFETQLDLFPNKNLRATQLAKVEWDEKGAKAEAVTGISPTSMPDFFVINRPFYFVIRIGKLWLFTGYVSKIDKSIN